MLKYLKAPSLLRKPIVMPDAELDRWAKEYHKNAKIRNRIAFVEFMSMPEEFLRRSKNWPEATWEIDFTEAGDHQKMWVNDKLSGKTIAVPLIYKNNECRISAHLDDLKRDHGMPDSVFVDSVSSQSNDIVRAWCRRNNCLVSHPTPTRPQAQRIGAHDQEAA